MEQKKELLLLQKIIFVLKMAFGSGLAWQIAVWAGSKYPYLAPISVIFCLQATLLKSVRFGISRMIGTILGVTITLLLAANLPHNGWSIAFVLLVSTGISLLFGASITSLHQIALSALLVLVFEHKLHGYGFDRIIDSFIGVVVALVIHAFIKPPNFTSIASESVQNLTGQLVKKLDGLAVWIENGAPKKNYFESDMNFNLWNSLQQASQNIIKAENSFRYNPFKNKSKKELNDAKQKLFVLRKEFAIIESFYDIIQQWVYHQPMTQLDIQLWSENFRHLANALQNWSHNIKFDISNVINESYLYHDYLTIETRRFLNTLKTYDVSLQGENHNE